MEPRPALAHLHNSWKLSALVWAFVELLLATVILLQVAVACLTSQLIKFLGLELPFWNGSCLRPAPCTNVEDRNDGLDVKSTSQESENGYGCKKGVQNEGTHTFDHYYCPKCKGVWTMKKVSSLDEVDLQMNQRLSSWNNKIYETAARQDHKQEVADRSELQSKVVGMKQQNNVLAEIPSAQKASAQSSDKSQVEQQADEVPVSSVREVANYTEKVWDLLSSSYDQQGLYVEGTERLHSGCTDSEGKIEDFIPVSQVLLQGNIAAGVLTGVSHETEDVINALKDALHKEQETCSALYAELEKERNASETAVNEAMAMIMRLQEEKAALQLQGVHFKRMVEEKVSHDDQAMQLMKEILYKKERENFLLEKEVKLVKSRCLREARRVSKRRKVMDNLEGGGKTLLTLQSSEGIEIPSPSGQESPLMLDTRSTDERSDELATVSAFTSMSNSQCAKPSLCSSWIAEEQHPLKRLKSITNRNGTLDQGMVLGSNMAVSQGLLSVAFVSSNNDTVKSKGDSEGVSKGQRRQSLLAMYKDDIGSVLTCLTALEEHLKAHNLTKGLDANSVQPSKSHISSVVMNSD